MTGKGPKVYCEINDRGIVLALLRRTRAGYEIPDFRKIPFEGPHVCENYICNPSFIFKQIHAFLHDNRMTKAEAVVCFPGLKAVTGDQRTLLELQVALCVCKAGLTVYKLIDRSLMPDEKEMA